jgi:hypothetical protein
VKTSGIAFMSPSKVEPLRRGLPVQTNFKEFMKNCRASLILPENALIIARKVMPQNVRLSKTEVAALKFDFRYSHRSGHCPPDQPCPRCANKLHF